MCRKHRDAQRDSQPHLSNSFSNVVPPLFRVEWIHLKNGFSPSGGELKESQMYLSTPQWLRNATYMYRSFIKSCLIKEPQLQGCEICVRRESCGSLLHLPHPAQWMSRGYQHLRLLLSVSSARDSAMVVVTMDSIGLSEQTFLKPKGS